MGGLRKEIPFTFWMMTIGTLALTGVGIPFTSIGFAGYVSKDAIIEASYASHGSGATYAFVCVVARRRPDLVLFLAAGVHDLLRPARRLGGVAAGARRHGHATTTTRHDDHGHGHGDHAAHESPQVMLVPLAVLALGAVVAGVAVPLLVHRRRRRGLLEARAVPRRRTTRSSRTWSMSRRWCRCCRR